MRREPTELGQRLAEVAIPAAAGARERALTRVLEAGAGAPAPGRRHRPALRIALGLVAAAAIAGVAVAATGSTSVTRLVRDAVSPARSHHPATPARLHVTGGLLVRSRGRIVLVHAGSARVLGRFRDASWSTHGRFVALSGGRHLVVVDPRSGRERWTITAAAPVSGARWSLEPTVPPCCRIAFLTAGPMPGDGSLHVIAGDGTGDRIVAGADPRVAPAWRPASTRHELAFVRPDGALARIDADTGAVLATPVRLPARPTKVAWSEDGRFLLVLSPRRLAVYDARSGTVERLLLAHAPDTLTAASFLGGGRTVAVLRGTSRIELLPPRGPAVTLAQAAGPLGWLATAPDGQSILTGRAGSSVWLLTTVARSLAGASPAQVRSPRPGAVVLEGGWHAVR